MLIIDYFIYLYLKTTKKRINYSWYLTTKHWKRLRNKTIKRYDFKCAICASRKDLQIHHNSYLNLFHERKSDVVCLCRRCHIATHSYIWNNHRKAA